MILENNNNKPIYDHEIGINVVYGVMEHGWMWQMVETKWMKWWHFGDSTICNSTICFLINKALSIASTQDLH